MPVAETDAEFMARWRREARESEWRRVGDPGVRYPDGGGHAADGLGALLAIIVLSAWLIGSLLLR